MSCCQNGAVDRPELQALLTSEALTLLESITQPHTPDDVLTQVSALRKQGHSLETVSAVMGQLSLRTKAQEKFGPFAARMLFSREGLEVASRLEVSSHHAGRFLNAGVSSVIDLGCGLGGDSLAFAGAGLSVRAVEADEVTAALATYNLTPFDNATVEHGDVANLDLSPTQALWCDPARRHGTTRFHNPDDWSPSLEWVFSTAQTHPMGIKLAPGMERSLIPEGMEAQWVSYKGSVLEMVLWSGVLAREGITRSALILRDGGATEVSGASDSADVAAGPLQDYLLEPDGAIIRARLIGDLARQFGATMIDPTIAYMTGPNPVRSPLVQCFEVLDAIPYTQKSLHTLIAGAQVGTLEIKKRGIDVDPAALRASLPLKGSTAGTLILTRVQGKKTALLARRVS